MFQDTLDVRPHLLVLNKMDLADLSNKQVRCLASFFFSWNIINRIKVTQTNFIYTAEDPDDAGKIWSE